METQGKPFLARATFGVGDDPVRSGQSDSRGAACSAPVVAEPSIRQERAAACVISRWLNAPEDRKAAFLIRGFSIAALAGAFPSQEVVIGCRLVSTSRVKAEFNSRYKFYNHNNGLRV